MGKIRTTLVSAIVSLALLATGLVQAEAAGASTVTPTPSPTSTSTAPPSVSTPDPTDSPTDPVPASPDPDPVDPGGFKPADPSVTPDSSTDELDAQVKAQEELQSQVPEHKSLSPLVNPLAGSGFDPGYIISDELFYNGNAASAESVQNFLNVMLPSCRSGYVCLKDYSVPTVSRPASAMCNAYNGGGVETAATIIYKVGVACGISQKALLVLLQKEQSLITDDWPSARQYAAATGYACPDTADCDANYAGFYNQVYWAAYQFKRYGNPPGTSNYFTWYKVDGSASAVRYHPNAACGSSQVVIRNKATAALYYYTPYQPNQAAINGSPDTCSAFGNLNFYSIYSRWFGNPVGVPPVPPIGSLEKVLAASRSFTIAGWAADPTDYGQTSRVRIDVTLSDGSKTSATVDASGYRPDVSFAFPQAGAYRGFSWSIPIGVSGNYRACISALPVAGNTTGPTDLGCRTRFYSASTDSTPAGARIEGADRYEAAVAMSKASFPSGTSAPVVFVVTGADYPDALSAGPAAVKQKGSLLLTPREFLHPSTAAEIRRLNPQRIVVVGGEASVPPAVFSALSKLIPSATTTRIGGADRYEVSRSVATSFFTTAADIFVATGTNYPDALASGAAAGRLSRPVLLVDGSTSAVDQVTRDTLSTLGTRSATIVGGPNSVSTGFETSLGSIVSTNRKSGVDRISAAVNLNASIYTQSNEVYIATGFNFPDALAGSALAGKRSVPLYLVMGNCVPQSVLAEIVRLKATKVTVLGGPNSVSKAAEQLQGC
jgi:putative cell wall-binding protein